AFDHVVIPGAMQQLVALGSKVRLLGAYQSYQL
ncbi:prephenate dehydratase, partial [Bacillus subtilis]